MVHHVPCWVKMFQTIFNSHLIGRLQIGIEKYFWVSDYWTDFQPSITILLATNEEFKQRFISSLFHEMIQSYSKNNSRFEFLISSSRGQWQPLTNISADNWNIFSSMRLLPTVRRRSWCWPLEQSFEIWDTDCCSDSRMITEICEAQLIKSINSLSRKILVS